MTDEQLRAIETQAFREHFQARISKSHETNGCLLWLGTHDKYGRGAIHVCGRLVNAPRIAIILSGRKLANDKYACHSCDNPACVEPTHLWAGTQLENMADRDARGRHGSKTKPESIPRGDAHWSKRFPERRPDHERHGMCRLTEADVLEIRRRYATGEYFQREIAEAFGISLSHTSGIIRGAFWKTESAA